MSERSIRTTGSERKVIRPGTAEFEAAKKKAESGEKTSAKKK